MQFSVCGAFQQPLKKQEIGGSVNRAPDDEMYADGRIDKFGKPVVFCERDEKAA